MSAKPATGFRWEIRPPDTDYVMSTDDFTLDEVETLEEQTGVPWLLLEPSNWKVARAMLIVAMLRSGLDDEQVAEKIKGYNLRDMHGVFTLVPPRRTPASPPPTAVTAGGAAPPTSASS